MAAAAARRPQMLHLPVLSVSGPLDIVLQQFRDVNTLEGEEQQDHLWEMVHAAKVPTRSRGLSWLFHNLLVCQRGWQSLCRVPLRLVLPMLTDPAKHRSYELTMRSIIMGSC
jgi:hypothetical protein